MLCCVFAIIKFTLIAACLQLAWQRRPVCNCGKLLLWQVAASAVASLEQAAYMLMPRRGGPWRPGCHLDGIYEHLLGGTRAVAELPASCLLQVASRPCGRQLASQTLIRGI